jgi:hypothetical protein
VVNVRGELNTITSTLQEVATRITTIVDGNSTEIPSEVLNELVAAERSVGALLRRLTRAASQYT